MKAVVAMEGVSKQDKQVQINLYQSIRFDENERRRLEITLRLLIED